ncbi:Dynein light chain DLC [Fasciola gigantica]|uniref:Dynein light chain n=2 Tax=Fasciola TaxID=6191 RepID=A0A4E0RX40_FASHE|nr:Dynein light chain DLC [Fasciola hepatica]TPP58531.1 Dynein light chain DLC [Fasciola gigantica]
MIKETDMSEEMQNEAIRQAEKAIEMHTVEKDVAAYIKKYFDRKYSTPWHCIVGQNFGSYVTHESNYFIYFYVGKLAILLFKTG